jgi:hypothetical protein
MGGKTDCRSVARAVSLLLPLCFQGWSRASIRLSLALVSPTFYLPTFVSQMAAYSLCSALLLTRAHGLGEMEVGVMVVGVGMGLWSSGGSLKYAISIFPQIILLYYFLPPSLPLSYRIKAQERHVVFLYEGLLLWEEQKVACFYCLLAHERDWREHKLRLFWG